jgi:hypothetical protein
VISAPLCDRVEAITTRRPGFIASSLGSASSPPITGISMSSTTTSGSTSASLATPWAPSGAAPASTMSACSLTQRLNSPRTTAESSMIMTRMGRTDAGEAEAATDTEIS